MGFRYRKSINLGGGFKINLSKSGVGYSWGGKGFRFTKKAKGGMRKTLFIPGTGVSWSHDSRSPLKKKNYAKGKELAYCESDNTQNITEYKNANISEVSSLEFAELIKRANIAILSKNLSLLVMVVSLFVGFVYPISFIITGISATIFLILISFYRINLEYDIDNDLKAEISARFKPLEQIISSEKIWRIIESKENENLKYSSGAKNSLKRRGCKTKKGVPYPFKTDEHAITITDGKEKFVFLPDKLFILQQAKIGAFNYDDIKTEIAITKFLESEIVPKDAKVIGKTWKYVNKSGGMDKRFKDNEEIPICAYGKMQISSTKGINTLFMFSNTDIDL